MDASAASSSAALSLDMRWRLVPVHEIPEFADLPAAVRDELDLLEMIFRRARAVHRGHGRLWMEEALHLQRRGFSAVSLRRKWDAYRASGGNWRVLIDRAKAPLPETGACLAPEFLDFWRGLCLENQRKCRPAHRALLRRLRQWRTGLASCAIPGYAEPPADTVRGHPEGWSYENLMRHAPDAYLLRAARQGRAAAADHRLKVPMTRVGLRVGQFRVYDDLWHDHVLSFRGAIVRPLELHGFDLAAAYKPVWGLRPRLARADGSHEQIKEREMRWLVAADLRTHGVRTDERGTTLLVERGTAAISTRMEEILADRCGVRVQRNGMLGDAAFAGQYAGRSKGNFRFKAALESLGNLIHNEMAALPGQVGKDRDHQPEQLHGLVKYHDALVRAMATLPPEHAALLRLPVLTWDQFVVIAGEIYEAINRRTDHDLEGWVECGHETIDYRVGDKVLSQADLLALPPGAQAALVAALDPRDSCARYKSPREVWLAGRGELTPLSASAAGLLLGPDLARERVVRGGEIAFEDAEMGPGVHRYAAILTELDGAERVLPEGEKFACYANPFATGELILSDARGRFLGTCPRWTAVCRADAEALQRKMGAVAKFEATRLGELARLAHTKSRERLALHEHNARVMDEAAGGPEARARARSLARAGERERGNLTPEDMRAATDVDRVQGETETFTAEEIAGLFSEDRGDKAAD